MNFNDMVLKSLPSRTNEPNGKHFICSNFNNFLSNSEDKNVCDEIVNRFNEYPQLLVLVKELVYIAKIVDETCFSNPSNDSKFNDIKKELEQLIFQTDDILNKN